MPLPMVMLLTFLMVFGMSIVLLMFLRQRQNPTVKRMLDLKKGGDTDADSEKEKKQGEKREKLHHATEKLLKDLSRFMKKDEKQISKASAMLLRAGYHREDSVRVFFGIKTASALVFFSVFFVMGLMGERSTGTVFLLSAVMGFVGLLFPETVLKFKIRKRQEKIASSLPDTLDLLVISVEAGLGLNAALLRVGSDLEVRCPPMSQEFDLVNQELRTGSSREQALRNLAKRNEIEDLRILVGALVLADRLGTSIADTLRAQADSLRTRIRQKAEEQAAKAGIKMLFPLVLFILPALIMVLMGPGLIKVFRIFQ